MNSFVLLRSSFDTEHRKRSWQGHRASLFEHRRRIERLDTQEQHEHEHDRSIPASESFKKLPRTTLCDLDDVGIQSPAAPASASRGGRKDISEARFSSAKHLEHHNDQCRPSHRVGDDHGAVLGRRSMANPRLAPGVHRLDSDKLRFQRILTRRELKLASGEPSGFIGAGRPLNVPTGLAEPGFSAPESDRLPPISEAMEVQVVGTNISSQARRPTAAASNESALL